MKPKTSAPTLAPPRTFALASLEEAGDRLDLHGLRHLAPEVHRAQVTIGRETDIVELDLVEAEPDQLHGEVDVRRPHFLAEGIDPGDPIHIVPGPAGRGIGDGEVRPGLGQRRVLEDNLAGDGVDVVGVQGVEDGRHVVVGDDRAGLVEELDPGVDVDALFLDIDDEGVQLGAVDQVEEAVEIVPVVHGRVEVDRLGRELIGGSIGRAGESRAQSRRAGKGRSGEPLQRPAPREGRNRTYSRTAAHPVVPHTPVPLSPRDLCGRPAAQSSPISRRSSVPAVLTTGAPAAALARLAVPLRHEDPGQRSAAAIPPTLSRSSSQPARARAAKHTLNRFHKSPADDDHSRADPFSC